MASKKQSTALSGLKEGWAWTKEEDGVVPVIYTPSVVSTRAYHRTVKRTVKQREYVVPKSAGGEIMGGWGTSDVYASEDEAWEALQKHHDKKVDAARKALLTVQAKADRATRNHFDRKYQKVRDAKE
jgi:hypothetical protein